MTIWSLYKSKKAGQKAVDKFIAATENARLKAEGKEPVLNRKQKLKRLFSRIYPPFRENFTPNNFYEKLFARGTKEHTIFRLIRNILLLESFGVVMYFVLALKYSKDPGQTGTFVAIVVHFLLTLMFVFPTVMYYFMLSTHRMMSSKVRTLILVVIVSIAFEGPAMNALGNVHLVAEGVACVQTDVMEAAKSVDENLAKNGEFGLGVMQSLVGKLAKPANFFKKQLQKYERKISRVVEVVRRTWSHLSDLTNKCKKMMHGPHLTCLNMFHAAYIKCATHERNIGLNLCGSLETAKKVCKVGKSVGDSVCNFPSAVKGGITEGVLPFYKGFAKKALQGVKGAHYFHIKAFKYVKQRGRKVKQEIKNLKTLRLKANFKRGKLSSFRRLKENLKKTLTSIIDTYKKAIRLIVTILHWTFIPMALCWPFFSTALFMYKFNYREEYKNVYMTSEFERIDLDCALKGKTKVLPLNKDEKTMFVARSSWTMTHLERRGYRMTVSLTVIAMATPVIFILMDVCLYLILYGVYEVFDRTKIDFPSHYELKISGDGFGAKMMNTLLDTFSPITNGIKERDEKWRACFREPTPPDYGLYFLMLFLFIICLILCRTKVWLAKQSLALADYFFPHRARPRALWLYNKILSNRKNIMGAMMNRQKAFLADDQLAGREMIIRRGLQSRGFIRVNCCKCRKAELRLADQANTRLCTECGAFYCIDCFSMTETCRDCESDMQTIDGVELYYEHLSDDEEGTMDSGEETEADTTQSKSGATRTSTTTTKPTSSDMKVSQETRQTSKSI